MYSLFSTRITTRNAVLSLGNKLRFLLHNNNNAIHNRCRSMILPYREENRRIVSLSLTIMSLSPIIYLTLNNNNDKSNYTICEEANEVKESPDKNTATVVSSSENPQQQSMNNEENDNDYYNEEEERSCPFCKYFLDSPCKDTFIQWQKCVKVRDTRGKERYLIQ